MKVAVSSRFAERFILWDALFVMVFSIWWAMSSKNLAIIVIGAFAGMALLDLSARVEGSKPLLNSDHFPMVILVWGSLLIFAVMVTLRSLGILY